MYYVGIDIGSTSSKTAVFQEEKLISTFSMPTGWSSRETSENILKRLNADGIVEGNSAIVATGYGRVCVPYAKKTVTEITCHGKGAIYLFGEDGSTIDIGGQDTKVIRIKNGTIEQFLMNDKCSAGTGRFLEIMANSLGVSLEELSLLAEKGKGIAISSMCTVFAESEVIGLIGNGTPRADIAFGIVASVIDKVTMLCSKLPGKQYFLTGGLCENQYMIKRLENSLQKPVKSNSLARYAGAIGAALIGRG